MELNVYMKHAVFKFLLFTSLYMEAHSSISNFFLEVHGLNGKIKSPNFPNLYPKNASVVWTLTTWSEYLIEMNFTYFDVEKVKDCRYDYVQVRNHRTGNWSTHMRYCNIRKPGVMRSNEAWVQVRLITDADKEATGFSLSWMARKRDKDSTSRSSQTAVASPNSIINVSATKTETSNVMPVTRTITISSCVLTEISTIKSKYSTMVINKSHSPIYPCPTREKCATEMQSTGILEEHRDGKRVHSITHNSSESNKLPTGIVSSIAKTSVNEMKDHVKTQTTNLMVMLSALIALFAIVSLLLGGLLCTRVRANRIQGKKSFTKNQTIHQDCDKDSSHGCNQCSVTPQHYTTFCSPKAERDIQLTTQTNYGCSLADDEEIIDFQSNDYTIGL